MVIFKFTELVVQLKLCTLHYPGIPGIRSLIYITLQSHFSFDKSTAAVRNFAEREYPVE